MRIYSWLLGTFLISIANIAYTSDGLTVFENKYSSKLYGFAIEVTSRLTAVADNQYELYFNADSAFGSITESSQLRWNSKDQIVIPIHYIYKRKGIGKNREDEVSFDWSGKTVNNLKKNTSLPMNLAGEGAQKLQDSLSYQLQLRHDLMAGKNNFVYPISDGKKIKEYRFEIVAEEVLKTPLGDVNTVKVKRTYTNDNRVTYAWFAKEFQYLLVRLQQEENGSAYTIDISKASLNGKAIEHF